MMHTKLPAEMLLRPYQRLAAAILVTAARDYKALRLNEFPDPEVVRWFKSKDEKAPSFHWCCSVCSMSPEFVLAKLRSFEKGYL